MSLPVPIVGVDPGPDWANNINASLGILDQHNHSAGSGVQITPAGINISTDLPMNNNNLTLVKTVNFSSQLAPLPGLSPNVGAIYVAGNELYYNDEIGNVVQITNTGSVNAGAGSITGLPSGTASASYNSLSGTFVWQSSTSTAANMDNASVTIREQAASANGIKISSPPSLAADYQVFLFPALPASQKIVTLDNAGNLGASLGVDNSTIDISSNNLEVKSGGITKTQIQAMPIGTPAPAGGFALSASSGNFNTSAGGTTPVTNMSVTITTSGRPIMIGFMGDPSGNPASIGFISNATAEVVYEIWLGPVGTGTQLFTQDFAGEALSSSVTQTWIPAGSLNSIDTTSTTPGTYTYNLATRILTPGPTTAYVRFVQMYAYEL